MGGETMTRTRAEYDADRQHRHLPKTYMTAENRYEVPCSLCGKAYFFDENAKIDIERTLVEARDNPFICIECENDYDELAHQN